MTGKIGNFQMPPFNWFLGKVVDVKDPEELGRVRVRIHGHHTPDEEKISNKDLVWASIMMPTTEASISGIGHSPTGLVPGVDCVGFFMDGDANQMPVIMGTLVGKSEKPKKDDKTGFKDPDGIYPKYEDKESDVNRLARKGNEDKTIVKKKKDEREKKIAIAGGNETWDEPETKFAPEYPMNRVMETESGHIVEHDDTKDAERIHEYHRAGTFYEIYPDGSKVTKIVKDNYEIVLGKQFVYIKGDTSITIDGNSAILILKDCNIEIKGNKTETIKGNYNLSVDGDYSLDIKGNQNSKTDGLEKRKADKIHLN